MRIVVIGTEAMAHKLSARYGTPFFLVGEDMDAVRLEGLCAASNWIAVAQTAPEQPMLLERADAVMICMEAQAARAMRKLFGRPQRTPELSPEQIAALRQRYAAIELAEQTLMAAAECPVTQFQSFIQNLPEFVHIAFR